MSDSLRANQADWRLECVGLSVSRGGRRVLADVTVALQPGECVSVVGPNGSGKTTLMLALLEIRKVAVPFFAGVARRITLGDGCEMAAAAPTQSTATTERQ